MKKLIGLALLVASAAVYAERCYLTGETEDGMNKICYYDCASGTAAVTVRITKICPLSIQR